MAAYAERVFFMQDLSDNARREALHGFLELFEPGYMVAIALGTEKA